MNEFRNAEGYSDPTAGEAVSTVTRKERKRSMPRNRKPVVYLCSRYAGDIEKNIAKARSFCRFAVEHGYVPIAVHLFYPQFLRDEDPIERKQGMTCGKALMDRCDEVWFFGTHFSKGMREEYLHARRKGYRIRCFAMDFRELTGNGGSDGSV